MRWCKSLALLAAMLLVAAGAALAGGEALSGKWKMTFYAGDEQAAFWLVNLESKDGKLSGKTVSLNRKVPPAKVEDVKITGDRFALNMELEKGPPVVFEGKLPKAGAKKIFGTLKLGANLFPATLEATTASNPFEMNKELLMRNPTDPRVFAAVVDLVREAKAEKATEKEVKEWVDISLKSAELFGPRMVEMLSSDLLEVLEKDFPAQAVELAKKAEEALGPTAPVEQRMTALSLLALVLHKAGKTEEAKTVEGRIAKMEEEGHAEHEKAGPGFKFEKFAGRKAKSNRAVLVELFTGAQCPPCVAADLSFDAAAKAFPSSDVILLQYHLHIPGPDALTNPDCEDRQMYYRTFVKGTPALILNGKGPDPKKEEDSDVPLMGGSRLHAEDRFTALHKAILPLLEKPAGAQVLLSAQRSGDKIDIKASVKELESPGEKVKLRLFLVEDWVRYKGRNGLAYHSRVVRDMPGGAAGFALPKKDSDHSASVDLNDLRKELTSYLNQFEKEEAPFPDKQRPMRLRNLSVVAVVQNDATREVLQAVDAPVKGK